MKFEVEKIVGDRRIRAHAARSSVIVRIEKVGDESKFIEWEMPKFVDYHAVMDQANLQTKDEDIRE